MGDKNGINTLFIDIGGVLLNNGWDRNARHRAAQNFALDEEEVNERHHLAFDAYETGKISLDEYLGMVVFYRQQPFSPDDFKAFMYAQSHPLDEMIRYVRQLKRQYRLKTVVVSNEGRELNSYRIHAFGLTEFIDTFVCSSFVHFRKPDADIFKVALDVSQSAPERIVYLDDRLLFVEAGSRLGIRSIQHVDVATTRAALAELGFALAVNSE
ncbi:MAG: HAD family phosphatase [Ferruginibacter sp.]|nr:HAD family phosphatase [Cytophagales bacterium]